MSISSVGWKAIDRLVATAAVSRNGNQRSARFAARRRERMLPERPGQANKEAKT
jgi:hypothetical protein